MKIDFTKFKRPIDAIDFSLWERNSNLDVSPEDAALSGLKPGDLNSEFKIFDCNVNFRFTSEHQIQLEAATVVADIRSNNSLRSIRVCSNPLTAKEVFDVGAKIIAEWGLHSFEDGEDLAEDELAPKADAIQKLRKWRKRPAETIPSYLAQTDANPLPGVWFLRLVINQHLVHSSRFVLIAAMAWRDQEFDNAQKGVFFWEHADAVIALANKQSSVERVSRVANSLLYAAARYCAFDYWTGCENRLAFEESQAKAIEERVRRFKNMLIENFDDHLKQFDSSGNGE